MQRWGRYPGLATLADQAMAALCAYGWAAGCKGARKASRDDNSVGQRKKSDAGDIERDRRTGGNAGGKQAGIAVPQTAGCKIVTVVFGQLSRRRGFAGGGVGRRAKTKRMLVEQAGKVTVANSGIELQRGMQPRRDELQAKQKDGKNQPEMTQAARSASRFSPQPSLMPPSS